ncbi:hypothetical protein NITMOv2_4029 [Nitrospira moscoviensis]|uniref:Uncharacterized protein n=1 Tax=Nitrospira moscoviensis TaxID=42253 RepID=A0A0K2GHI8_NITMO|nr:hypothetical protein NITMOv2_4029 [Nitrospira moscoviensis]
MTTTSDVPLAEIDELRGEHREFSDLEGGGKMSSQESLTRRDLLEARVLVLLRNSSKAVLEAIRRTQLIDA